MIPESSRVYQNETELNSNDSENDLFIMENAESRSKSISPWRALNHFDIDFLNDGVDLEIHGGGQNTEINSSDYNKVYELNNQIEPEDETDPDYKATEIDLDYNSDEENENENEDLDELYSDIKDIVSDQNQPINPFYNSIYEDNSQFLENTFDTDYEPPVSIKANALVYIIKSSPLIIAVFALLLISNITTSNDQIALTDMGLIHHKFYVLEKKLNEITQSKLSNEINHKEILSKQYKSFNEIDNKINNIEKQYSSQNKDFLSIHSKNKEFENEIKTINKKISSLNNIPNNSLKDIKEGDETLNILINDIKQLQASLDDIQTWRNIIDEKFNKFNSLINDIIIENLPNLIPISENNGRIQLSNKFNEYIQDLITNKLHETDLNYISWEDYVKLHKDEILNELGENNMKFVKKNDFLKDIEIIQSKFTKQLNELKNQVEGKKINSNAIDSKKITKIIKNLLDSELNDRFEIPKTKMINYGSIEHGAKVNLKLTTLPKLKRLRTETFDRIKNGLFDFFRRNFLGVKRKLIGLQDIELTSQLNSPSYVLLEDKSYWQCLVEDLPILFTIQLNEPIFVQEIGISHVREVNYLLDSAPKDIHLFIKPKDKKDYKKLIKIFSKYYNQDFSIKTMKGFLKIGEIQYNLKSPEIYQKFVLIGEIQELLNIIKIESVMLVIESNHGNEKVISLQNVRIYGFNEFEMKNSKLFLNSKLKNESGIENLGDDSLF